jgi:Cdc6-like AAA superfamily ATPase
MPKHPGGRPRIIKSPEEADKIIDEYLTKIEVYNDSNLKDRLFKVPTVEGMTLALGLACRQSFFEYIKREEFTDTIKRAKTRILSIQKELAMMGFINPTISIFNWKNNFEYKDTKEVDHGNKDNKPFKISVEAVEPPTYEDQ